jgi:hypothetical protein
MKKDLEVLIYQPEKSAMQSGAFIGKKWFMKFVNYEEEEGDYIFDIMNWEGGRDVLKTIKMEFSSEEEAIAFAKFKGFKYTISKNNERIIKPKSYASNFN